MTLDRMCEEATVKGHFFLFLETQGLSSLMQSGLRKLLHSPLLFLNQSLPSPVPAPPIESSSLIKVIIAANHRFNLLLFFIMYRFLSDLSISAIRNLNGFIFLKKFLF